MRRIRRILLTASLLAACTIANAQVDFSIEPESTCAGKAIKVTNKTSQKYQIAKFDFGDGIDAYGDELQHIYQTGGSYTVSLSVLQDDGTWSPSKMHIVSVGEKPTVTVSDNDKAGVLTASVSSGASIKWYCNGNEMKTTQTSLYYKESGEYKAVATLSNGCADSASVMVTYNDISGKDITAIKVRNNVITPGVMDGINDVLSIEDLPFEGPCEVSVFNSKGKLVYSNKNYSNTDGFAGTDDGGNLLPAGTYYYVIKSWGRRGCSGFVDVIR